MRKIIYPTLSVIIATYNSERSLNSCLQSIFIQDYPASFEVIIADGGSSDKTLKIALKYNVKILKIPHDKQGAEYNKGVGVSAAKNEVLVLIDHDNILPHKNWLRNMTLPLIENRNVTGVSTLYINYDPSSSLLDRYLALFGGFDPVALYLGKSDRVPQYEKKYRLPGKILYQGTYFIVKLSANYIPPIGANGFLIRREPLLKYAHTDPKHFFHTDVIVDLVRKGVDQYAFTKDSIVHNTGIRSITNFLKRRWKFLENNLEIRRRRRYSVYLPQDTFRLILFVIYTLTIVKPIYDSLYGFTRIRDSAWFIHPLLCYAFLIIYSLVTVKFLLRQFFLRFINLKLIITATYLFNYLLAFRR